MKIEKMIKEIVKENEKLKQFNLYERLILRIHRKLFKKFYHYARIEIVNKIL